MSDKVLDMTTASIRTLQHDMAGILSRVGGGEEIVLTRHNKPIAKLVPLTRKKKAKTPSRDEIQAHWAKYHPVMRTKSKVSGAEIVAWGRGHEDAL